MQLEPELQSELQTLIANWVKDRKPSITSAVIVVCVQIDHDDKSNSASESILDKSIGVLGLCARSENALNNGGGSIRPGSIRTVRDIVRSGGHEILGCRNMGYKSILEIREALSAHGVKLDHTWKLRKSLNRGWVPNI